MVTSQNTITEQEWIKLLTEYDTRLLQPGVEDPTVHQTAKAKIGCSITTNVAKGLRGHN